jgi:hypothetical protein
MPQGPQVVSGSTEVAAAPQRVWELVSDLPSMGEYSPENTGGAWRGGATGPAPGAVFRGRNGKGLRRWSTTSTVTRCVPGREFAFTVRAAGLPVAEWSYEIEPVGDGCRVTETWTDRRGALITRLGGLTTGVADRAEFTAQSIEHTLRRVKARAEQD